MKNSKLKFGFLLLLISSVSFFNNGCSKDRIQEKSLNQYSDVNQYLDTKKQEEQEFTIDTSGTGPIPGNQGTNIWIGKEILMYPNGDSVTWPFTVKLVELYTPKDMIYYRMPTISAGKIMETGGEIRLRAFKNGTELVLRPNCSIPIEMPSAAPKNYMRVFYGVENATYVDWTDDLSSLGVSSVVNPVFTTNSVGYQNNIARLGWLNCGFIAGTTTGHTLTFTSTTDNLANVGIFIYFPTTKTVMQVYNGSSNIIPSGSSVKIIAIGYKSTGELFSWSQNLTVTASDQFEVTMTSISDANLTALLDAF